MDRQAVAGLEALTKQLRGESRGGVVEFLVGDLLIAAGTGDLLRISLSAKGRFRRASAEHVRLAPQDGV
jgi:hypothetical protein